MNRKKNYRLRIAAFAAFSMGLVVIGGCSSSSRFEPSGNPLLDLRNPQLLERDRVASARAAWAEVESGVRDRERTRYAMKNLAWSSGTDSQLRLVVIELLMSDTSESGSADSRSMARLLLPTERRPEVIRVIAQRGVEGGWSELVPALVRSYSRVSPNVPDSDRDERTALLALSPGMSIEQIVFDVFLHPSRGVDDGRELAVLRSAQRTRDEAWALLARLDKSGEIRRAFLGNDSMLDEDTEPESRQLVLDLRAARDDFGILPDTASEVEWLWRLRHHPDQRNREQNQRWWSEVSAVVAGLSSDQRDGLRMYHLEAIRWSGQSRPAWLSLDTEGLFAVASERLGRRIHHKRDHERGELPRRERLGDWRDELVWGDLVCVLVSDDSLQNPVVSEQIFTQRALDKKDTSTEYGGVIETDPDSGWRAVLYRPRARDRVSDRRFVASDDMFLFSDRALVHYHFHADHRNNNKYAGPSRTDLVTANESGRASLVLTSIGKRELNVDLYFPSGVVVDLGQLVSLE